MKVCSLSPTLPISPTSQPLATTILLLTIFDLLTQQIHLAQPNIREPIPTTRKNEIDVYAPLGKWSHYSSKHDTACVRNVLICTFWKKHMYIPRHFLEVHQEKCQQLSLRWETRSGVRGRLLVPGYPLITESLSHCWISYYTHVLLISIKEKPGDFPSATVNLRLFKSFKTLTKIYNKEHFK